jgi:uncharacterized alkaline shock family protein YloU
MYSSRRLDKMKVKELIEILKEMPQEAKIDLEIITPYGTHGSAVADLEEVYEGVNDNVVIQGYEI